MLLISCSILSFPDVYSCRTRLLSLSIICCTDWCHQVLCSDLFCSVLLWCSDLFCSTSKESPEMTRAQSCFLLKALSSRWASPLLETCSRATQYNYPRGIVAAWGRVKAEESVPVWRRGCPGSWRPNGSFWRCTSPSPVCLPSTSKSKENQIRVQLQRRLLDRMSSFSRHFFRTLMPAFLSSSSVGRTSACSWSSTPVRHRSSISLSRLSTTAATFRPRSWMLSFAWL